MSIRSILLLLSVCWAMPSTCLAAPILDKKNNKSFRKITKKKAVASATILLLASGAYLVYRSQAHDRAEDEALRQAIKFVNDDTPEGTPNTTEGTQDTQGEEENNNDDIPLAPLDHVDNEETLDTNEGSPTTTEASNTTQPSPNTPNTNDVPSPPTTQESGKKRSKMLARVLPYPFSKYLILEKRTPYKYHDIDTVKKVLNILMDTPEGNASILIMHHGHPNTAKLLQKEIGNIRHAYSYKYRSGWWGLWGLNHKKANITLKDYVKIATLDVRPYVDQNEWYMVKTFKHKMGLLTQIAPMFEQIKPPRYGKLGINMV